MLTQIELLTEEESRKVYQTVHELKENWIQRHPLLPFYTLGLASYIDVPQDKPGYYKQAKYHNSILRDRLGWLYTKLANILEEHLQAPITYPENLALPGFHIFLSHPVFTQPVGSIHFDKSYMFHWEPTKDVDFSHPISFTLTISLPKNGGGLNVWDVEFAEAKQLNNSDLEKLAHQCHKTFYPYQVGSLVLHSGHAIHQIAPATNLQPGDERITLQGHGVRYQNCWQLHW
ncbi:hypothetical protein ACQFX9_22600 [Aliinostoc sp. HNIBRCY26]|uniref:hypothetical protein n=1 Tax=Aliinostoc sp. HNIBRCY26 TaxID=3418997 RepID=UPI003D00A8DD